MTLPILPMALFSGSQKVGTACRFNGVDERMTRTPGVSSAVPAHRTNTFSAWIRPDTAGVFMPIYSVDNVASGAYFAMAADGTLRFFTDDAIGPADCHAQGTGATVTIDAWNHVYCAYDSTQAVAANRVKFELNGVALTTNFIATPGLNLNNVFWFATLAHSVGFDQNSGTWFSGDMALVYGVDGGPIVPRADFADVIDGVLQAKLAAPTYGTNGFSLGMQDATNLGNDDDNGNDHTLVSIDASNAVGDGPPVSF